MVNGGEQGSNESGMDGNRSEKSGDFGWIRFLERIEWGVVREITN